MGVARHCSENFPTPGIIIKPSCLMTGRLVGGSSGKLFFHWDKFTYPIRRLDADSGIPVSRSPEPVSRFSAGTQLS